MLAIVVLAAACEVDGPLLHTDQMSYHLTANGVDVTLRLTSGSTTILGELCDARFERQDPDAGWLETDPQPPVDTSCNAMPVSVGPAGYLDGVKHVPAGTAPGAYRYVINIEDDSVDPPNHPDVPSNSFMLVMP
jgi:hypothetical protein